MSCKQKNWKKHQDASHLDESEAPMISCYLEVGNGSPGLKQVLDERVQTLRQSLKANALGLFEEAFRQD